MKKNHNGYWKPASFGAGLFSPSRFRLVVLLLLLFRGIFAPGFLIAETTALDASLDKQSVLSPLATKSLMLDAARKGDLLVSVGERGYILVSEDNGKNWNQVENVPTQVMLTGVFFIDSQTGWAVGHDAVILRTTDGGKSWQKVFSDPQLEMPLLDVWFKDAQNGFAIGAYGLFLATSDGGLTWKRRQIGEDDFHLNHISVAADGRLYISAESGKIYRSDDGGNVWQLLLLPYDGSLFCSLPLKGNVLLAFGLRGNAFRSENAGASWTKIETGSTAMLNDAEVLADGRIVVCGLGGALIESHDEGKSFERLGKKSGRQGISKILEAKGGGLMLFGEFGVQTTTLDASNT
ncbi:MAG: YCF48-related protein [Desulfobacterales bacterium]|jgi:photosystem II stability/assembly factor-like uncharacterized protein|nr:YCF48-related protein [Desulfobacterales bacterium]